VTDDDALAKYEAELQARFEAELRARRKAEAADKLARGWPPLSRAALEYASSHARRSDVETAVRVVLAENERSEDQAPEATRRLRAVESSETNPRPMAVPPLPNGVKLYRNGTILKAVELFESRQTRNDAAGGARLTPNDATRVRNLHRGGLLPLNEKGKLVPDPRVGSARGKIALRYLDERGEQWLDPYKSPPPLAEGS
jgi:hypothetical protein